MEDRLQNASSPEVSENQSKQKSLEPLFTPWKIGNCEIKNRIVMTSMGGTNLLGWMEKNKFDKTGAHFIKKVAENNVGLILPGCQPVYNPMFGQWLYKNKKMYQDLKEWMPEFHKTGAKLFVQLTAGFGRSFTITHLMEMLYTNRVLRFLAKPVMDLDKITASASPSPNRWSDKVPSREMTLNEIQEMVEAFAKTAKLLQDSGVDGVEIHAVHEGYLLDQFTLKYVNKRNDNYGGSFENRYRFAVDIVQAIKKACGNDFPVSLRYSVVSKTKDFRKGALPGEEFVEAGRDLAESEKAVKYLEEAGYDMLNCDNGTYDAWYWSHPPIYMPENCNLADVQHIKKYCDIPVVAAGRMDPYVGAEAVAAGTLDGVGFARNFLADQEWVTKLIEGRSEDIRPCILCHNACFNMSHYKGVPNDQDLHDSLNLSRCAVNAETMQWDKFYIEKTDVPQRVHIIGGGLGGMEAARVLKLRGHQPVIYEKTDSLGGVVIPGAAESYKQRMRDLLAWYRRQMKQLDIEIYFNTEITPEYDFDGEKVIVATGSQPIILQSVPGFDKSIEAIDFLNSLNDSSPKQKSSLNLGETIAVIGGSLTGCEIAYELALIGKKPFIVEMKDDLIAQKGVCLANSSYLREWFELNEVPVFLNSTLKEIKDNPDFVHAVSSDPEFEVETDLKSEEKPLMVVYSDINGKPVEIPCDSVISCVGYKPNPLMQKSGNRYLVGDCKEVGNLRTVIWRAYEVAMKI